MLESSSTTRQESERELDWREKASRDPKYYLDTEKGRKELSEMIQAETQRLLEELRRAFRRPDYIIWMSKFCLSCTCFDSRRHGAPKCTKWDARIVKPFYGKVIWATTVNSRGEEESIIAGVDWHSKSDDVPDWLVEKAVDRVNGGAPYDCFEPLP